MNNKTKKIPDKTIMFTRILEAYAFSKNSTHFHWRTRSWFLSPQAAIRRIPPPPFDYPSHFHFRPHVTRPQSGYTTLHVLPYWHQVRRLPTCASLQSACLNATTHWDSSLAQSIQRILASLIPRVQSPGQGPNTNTVQFILRSWSR